MHSLGINREGELRRQLANPGSPEKMAAETECVCVCDVGGLANSQLATTTRFFPLFFISSTHLQSALPNASTPKSLNRHVLHQGCTFWLDYLHFKFYHYYRQNMSESDPQMGIFKSKC